MLSLILSAGLMVAQNKLTPQDWDAAQPGLDAVKLCVNKYIPQYDDGVSPAKTVAAAAAVKCHTLVLFYAQELGQKQGYGPWWAEEFAADLEDGEEFVSSVLRHRVTAKKRK